MKKIIGVLFLLLLGCTAQKPSTQTPIYSITDNSIVIVADGGAQVIAQPENKTEQKNEASAETTAKSEQESWTLWAIFGILLLIASGIIAYKKGWLF